MEQGLPIFLHRRLNPFMEKNNQIPVIHDSKEQAARTGILLPLHTPPEYADLIHDYCRKFFVPEVSSLEHAVQGKNDNPLHYQNPQNANRRRNNIYGTTIFFVSNTDHRQKQSQQDKNNI